MSDYGHRIGDILGNYYGTKTHCCPTPRQWQFGTLRLLDLKQINCSDDSQAPIEPFGKGPPIATGCQALTAQNWREAAKLIFAAGASLASFAPLRSSRPMRFSLRHTQLYHGAECRPNGLARRPDRSASCGSLFPPRHLAPDLIAN